MSALPGYDGFKSLIDAIRVKVGSGDFEYSVSIAPPGWVRNVDVTVAMPKNVVYRQVLRSVKNFAA